MLNSKKRKFIRFLLAAAVFTLLTEFSLRYFWGFCDSVLMETNPAYEYIAQPNQDRFRFRNHIFYNSFSMRSPEPDSTAEIILGFGDSVINGGVLVDQDSLLTTLLSNELSSELKRKIQVLNISAGSWGPDNCYEYLKEKGDFNAKGMFLLASSHDATDNINFQRVVDHEKGYESKQYSFAIWEMVDRYLLPRIFNAAPKGTPIIKKGKSFNSGFANLNDYCKQKGIPFFVYLNPDSSEMRKGQFGELGNQIIQFCKEEQIPVFYSFRNEIKKDYRDIIHLKEDGHRRIADDLKKPIVAIFNKDMVNY